MRRENGGARSAPWWPALAVLAALGMLPVPAVADEARADPQKFTGEWTGTVSLKQTGDCPFGTDPLPAMLDWQVDADGTITIKRAKQGKIPMTETWEGQVAVDGGVTLVKTRQMSCHGEPHTMVARFAGHIQERDGAFRLSLAGDENWCPRQNCTAAATYEISHPRPAP